jgi:hypothetical protein
MKKLASVVFVALSLAAVSGVAAPAASATDSVVVRVMSCSLNGGVVTVPSGVPIAIHGIGYAQGTQGLLRDFLLKQQTTLTIVRNGTSTVYDLSGEWGPVQQLDKHNWQSWLPDIELGISLAPGESILATWDMTFEQPLLVAYPPVGPSGENGPFLIREDGPYSCLITAE